MKASWQGLSQAFLSSDFLKPALNGIINLTDGVTKFIDTFGTIPTLLGTVAAGLSIFKNIGIFKTINSDLDGFINKIGIANKSFAELANVFALGKSKGGFFGGFSAIKNSLSSGLTKADISNIQAYNQEIRNGTSAQTAWYRTMQTSSATAQNLVASANGGTVALEGMKAATIGSKVALIGAEAAAIAFNAALTMGISILIEWAVSGIQKIINAKKDLAEEVDELTSKFKQQHEELKKLQGDYNTADESSMASRYAKLSQGVDGLGKNVSLTADEYSEYQSIVNQIAEQIPSLISGYDSQGNAILSCKGNVEELTKAYEKLIHTQNQEILGNAGKIEKDFKNTLKDANKTDFLTATKMTSDTMDGLKKIYESGYKDTKQIEDFIKNNINDNFAGQQIEKALKEANVEIEGSWMWDMPAERVAKTLSKLMKTDPQKVGAIVSNYYSQFADEVEKQKTIAQATLSEAFDVSNAISGLDYGNISEEMQDIAYQTVNSLDYDFLSNLSEKGKTVEQWTKEMLKQLNSISKEDNAEIKTAFELQTKFNGGEITYGEYVQSLKNVESTIDNLNLKDTAKNQLKINLGLDENGIVDQYDALRERLVEVSTKDIKSQGHFTGAQDVMKNAIKEAEDFLDSMTASEYTVAVDLMVKGKLDLKNFDIKSLRAYIEKEAKIEEALNYTIAIDVETENLAAFNTAMAESVSGAGLSSESIAVLKSRYAELESEGYNLSAMFEETSNGIHLNREAVSELEQAYANQKLTETDGQLKVLKDRYDELTTKIKNCTDAGERAALYTEQQKIIDKINDLGTLAAQYEGLTSAYNQWQSAESAGQERDMYESIIEGFENVKDEISRGWIDDGTVEFLELLTGKTDLAGKSGKELKKIYKSLDDTIKDTTYSVRNFFTVDKDGNSTNTGVYNFLDAIGQLEEEKFGGKDVVKRDKTGNIIGFDFELVAKKDKKGNVIKNGDQVIAEALGISEELVQIMVRASDDAGFVVNLEGTYTQLADLKTQAETAKDSLIDLKEKGLKQLKNTDVNFNLNAEGNDLVTEQGKAVKLLDKFKKDGKIDLKMKGAKEALDIAEYLTIKLDDLTEPKFMQIDTSDVDKDLRDPIEKIQKVGDLCKEKHLITLTGDTKELKKVEGEINKAAEEIEKLDPEVKAQVGIDEDWDAKTIADKIEKGEIEIPASLELDVQMSEDIKDLRLLMMGQLGLASKNEIALKVKYDIDESVVDGLTEDQKEVVVKYLAEHEEVDKYTPKEKKALVKYIADGGNLDKYTPEEKQGIVKYLADGGNIESYTPEQKQAIVEYLTDSGDPDSWTPEQKQAVAKFKKDSAEVDNYTPENKKAIAKFIKDSIEPDNYQPPDKTQNVKANLDSSDVDNHKFKDKQFTVKAVLEKIGDWKNKLLSGGSKRKVVNGTANVNGTAFSNGSTGRAFKHGNWSTKESGDALVGELGTETLVRKGKYYTIGDTGAEFIHYEKGDIIFNHKQTEELFKYGKVTSGGGRGKAMASGTAFVGGSSGSGGGLKASVKDSSVGKTSSKKSSKSKSSSKDDAEEFEEVLDLIEIALKRVQREIDNLSQKASNVYKTWGSRNEALSKQISKVGSEIKLQQQAYSRYIKEASKTGLSSNWIKKIQSGQIDIKTIKDEALKEKIDEYQNWYLIMPTYLVINM